MRCRGRMVIVAPFREMIGEFEATGISISILKVDDNQSLVLVCWEKEW